MKADLFERVLAANERREPCVTVTRLGDGVQALVLEHSVHGDLSLDASALAELRSMLRAERSAQLACDAELFARVYAPPPRLMIVGAVHIAQALAPMARIAGFDVTVIDPRRAFADPARFDGVSLLAEWPDECLARLAPDARTAVVTLSHDPKIDDPALEAAITSDAFFVGALGSRKTHAARVERLTDAGLAARIDRIRAPVGLDLGGRAPAEIAVAILAQLIQSRYRPDA